MGKGRCHAKRHQHWKYRYLTASERIKSFLSLHNYLIFRLTIIEFTNTIENFRGKYNLFFLNKPCLYKKHYRNSACFIKSIDLFRCSTCDTQMQPSILQWYHILIFYKNNSELIMNQQNRKNVVLGNSSRWTIVKLKQHVKLCLNS